LEVLIDKDIFFIIEIARDWLAEESWTLKKTVV
jgi:hypothetical protein